MKVLIVESNPDLGRVWQRHLQRQGAEVTLVETQEAAILALYGTEFDIIVLDLVLETGSALAVADSPAIGGPRRASSLSPTRRSFLMAQSSPTARTPAPM